MVVETFSSTWNSYLSSWVILKEGNFSRNIDLALFFMDRFLVICLRLWTKSATVVHNVFEATEESRVAMQVDLTILLLIPFRVE